MEFPRSADRARLRRPRSSPGKLCRSCAEEVSPLRPGGRAGRQVAVEQRKLGGPEVLDEPEVLGGPRCWAGRGAGRVEGALRGNFVDPAPTKFPRNVRSSAAAPGRGRTLLALAVQVVVDGEAATPRASATVSDRVPDANAPRSSSIRTARCLSAWRARAADRRLVATSANSLDRRSAGRVRWEDPLSPAGDGRRRGGGGGGGGGGRVVTVAPDTRPEDGAQGPAPRRR